MTKLAKLISDIKDFSVYGHLIACSYLVLQSEINQLFGEKS